MHHTCHHETNRYTLIQIIRTYHMIQMLQLAFAFQHRIKRGTGVQCRIKFQIKLPQTLVRNLQNKRYNKLIFLIIIFNLINLNRLRFLSFNIRLNSKVLSMKKYFIFWCPTAQLFFVFIGANYIRESNIVLSNCSYLIIFLPRWGIILIIKHIIFVQIILPTKILLQFF